MIHDRVYVTVYLIDELGALRSLQNLVISQREPKHDGFSNDSVALFIVLISVLLILDPRNPQALLARPSWARGHSAPSSQYIQSF
jgi:hypothetical protein